MNCQYSTLLDVTACVVHEHLVSVQVRSIWNLIFVRIGWSSIGLEVYFRCRNKLADIALRYKCTHSTYMMYRFEILYCLGFSNRSCIGLRLANNSGCWI